MRLPLVIIAATFAALLGLTVALGEWSPEPAAREPTPVRVVADRVQQLREQRFDEVPVPQTVTAAEARRDAAADAARPEEARSLAADTALYSMLGLVPAGTDLQAVVAGLFEAAVAGYYDPRDGRLRVVDSGANANPVVAEITLAHELVHALDDQRFGLDTDVLTADGDAALAYAALVEGSATAVQTDYQLRFQTLEDLLSASTAAFGPSGLEDLPPFLAASLLFPYLEGQAWVEAVRERGGWPLVDLAFEQRPPASTEQVLHPRKWLIDERPLPVRLPPLERLAGEDATRLAAGSFGEYQLRQWLAVGGGGDAQPASRGWGGDRYELWREGGDTACESPCVARDTLVLRWRWDDPGRDAPEFLRSLRGGVGELFDAEPTGEDRWSGRGGAVGLLAGRSPALVLAPTAARAEAVLDALRSDRRGAR